MLSIVNAMGTSFGDAMLVQMAAESAAWPSVAKGGRNGTAGEGARPTPEGGCHLRLSGGRR